MMMIRQATSVTHRRCKFDTIFLISDSRRVLPGVLVSSFVRLPFFFELCPKVSLRLFDKMRNGFVVNGFSIYPSKPKREPPAKEEAVQLHYKSMCEIVGQAKILQLDHSNKSRSGTLGRAVQAFALYSDQNYQTKKLKCFL